jgi:hypothetical protein
LEAGASTRKRGARGGGENIMKLMTKELEKRFAKAGSQEFESDPIIIAKYFNLSGLGTWYATEYNPKERLFYGYVSLYNDYNDEWGYFLLDMLESFKGNWGLGIERDLYFQEKKASDIIPAK